MNSCSTVLLATLLLLGPASSSGQVAPAGDGTHNPAYGEDRCSVYPDPHFHTFDGNYFDFHLPCEYDLISTNELLVQVRTARPGGASWSLVAGFAMRLGGTGGPTLSIEESGAGLNFFSNGFPVAALPPTLPHPTGPVTIAPDSSGQGYWFNFSTGDSIHVWRFNGSGSIEINSIGTHGVFGGSRGLCGYYDNNQAHDYVSPFGDVTPIWSPQADVNAWALTWTSSPSLFATTWPCDQTTIPPSYNDNADALGKRATELCEHILPDRDLFEDCVTDILLTGDPTWANNPVYAKPMRCLQGCECDKHHPNARCLDRCLVDHDCIEVCPTKGCVCNVPRPEGDPLCQVQQTIEPANPFGEDRTNFGRLSNLIRPPGLMCKDNGCARKGGKCRNKGRECHCDRRRECPRDTKRCPDGSLLSRDPDNNCNFPPCPKDPIVCTQDVKMCPDGTSVSRDPNNDCEFFPCPPTYSPACPEDVHMCPDGSFVSRDPANNCRFPECPNTDLIFCPQDVKPCPDGTFVSRDPGKDCEFPDCPPGFDLTIDTSKVISGLLDRFKVQRPTSQPTPAPTRPSLFGRNIGRGTGILRG